MTRGMNNFVLVVYSNFPAFFIPLPCCILFYRYCFRGPVAVLNHLSGHRKRALPKLTLPAFSKIFLLAFLRYIIRTTRQHIS
ncbi:hypothetical protein CDL15_Pgr024374 [Punica granatum]|uniref:Uncharacterized protein n=1 Tax=Punica granatum TaxID=22663 RepID=A0A218XYA7_PUNGR|nr:hypothetical protein CDL15_Pgr024374 [Punica granatum]